ncbi:MAG TPA: M20 family metallopeptidase [Candidatus Avidesulfovibrio excrementigallinarum]|nr:M20 family metallopeptidase [Candidatus Avidesulfovibrio excrementigallinarum]
MEMQQHAERIGAYLDRRQAEIMAMIERLVNMDSFSLDGGDVDNVGRLVADWLRQAGFDVEVRGKPALGEGEAWMAGLGNLVVARTHPREAGPGIVFLAHMDTVFPRGTAASHPFRMDGDRAFGPGVADMKAGVAAVLFAARALNDLGLMPVPMTLMFSPDEELGSPVTTRHYRELLPGARAVLCAEPGFPVGGVTTERNGAGHMHLRVDGVAAHAGRCYEQGASAIIELAHKIVALDKLVDLERDVKVNTGLVDGGTSANSVAPHAEARLYLSFRTVEDAEQLVQDIRAIASRTFVPRTTTTLTGGIRLHPLRPGADTMMLFDMASRAGDAIGYALRTNTARGASEAGFTSSALGIPSLCSMGPEGAGLHSPDEYLVPSTILPRCKILALTAIQAAQAFAPSGGGRPAA